MPPAEIGINAGLLASYLLLCLHLGLMLGRRPISKIRISLAGFSILCLAASLLLRSQYLFNAGWLAGINHAFGCDNAPPTVEYRPGMTLCPGQTAVISVPLL